MIYFAYSDTLKRIKIGYSSNPKSRLPQIRCDVPDAVLIGCIPGTVKDEQALHLAFASYRDFGEWFADEPLLRSYINERKLPEDEIHPEPRFSRMDYDEDNVDFLHFLKSSIGPVTQTAWAKANGVSPAYVSDILAGRREPGKLVLDALGLERVVTYRRKKEKENELGS